MTNLIIFILACYGASNILAYGSIFDWWRDLLAKGGTSGYSLYKLFTCMMCLPTWVGFLFSFLIGMFGGTTPSDIIGIDSLLFGAFIDGVIASGGVYTLHVLVEKLEGE